MENVRAEVDFLKWIVSTTWPEHVHVKDVHIIYFVISVKHPNIIEYLQSFLWFLQKNGVSKDIWSTHLSFFPLKTHPLFFRVVFSWETRLVDPKAAAPNFRRGRSRCILWIPIMGFQGWGGWRCLAHERWMVDEGSNFHCLVEYFFVVEKVLNCWRLFFFGWVGGGSLLLLFVCCLCFFGV